MKRYALAAGAAAVSILLASCSSSGKSPKTTVPPATASSPTSVASAPSSAPASSGGITISNFAYSGTLTVSPGQKVTVTNKDSTAHTLTDKTSHKFDTGPIGPNGGTGTFTAPTAPGSYTFGCTFHPSMKGTLVVKG